MAKNKQNEGGTATKGVDRREILQRAVAGRPPAERLQIAAQMKQLDDEELLLMFGDNLASLTLESVVAGRPLHNWLGKTKGQIVNELSLYVEPDPAVNVDEKSVEELYGEIEEALQGGWTIGDEPIIRKVDEIFIEHELRGRGGAHGPMRKEDGSLADVREMMDRRRQQQAKRGIGAGARTRTSEPTFGDDQTPLSEFPDSVEEIMALGKKGVGPSTAEKIARMRQEQGLTGRTALQPLPPSALGRGDFDANPLVAPPPGGQGASELQPQRGPNEGESEDAEA